MYQPLYRTRNRGTITIEGLSRTLNIESPCHFHRHISVGVLMMNVYANNQHTFDVRIHTFVWIRAYIRLFESAHAYVCLNPRMHTFVWIRACICCLLVVKVNLHYNTIHICSSNLHTWSIMMLVMVSVLELLNYELLIQNRVRAQYKGHTCTLLNSTCNN